MTDHLAAIQSLKSRDYWQKYCVCEDWYEADFDYVVKQILQQNASQRRKQWECATIFLNLAHHGMFSGDKVGAAFGAGREKLLYIIAPLTQAFHATDLYTMQTVWKTANIKRFNTPEEFVKAAAPAGSNTDNMKVHDMDMRDLSYFADDSLDFCYSACAFEHIGDRDDFIQHLKEVRRVLKPGGIYSMTTEFLFGDATKTLPHNYKFDLEYLRELFIESGLDTAAEFDGHCDSSFANWPKPPVDSFMAKGLSNRFPTPFLYLEGIPYTTCNFLLSPQQGDQPLTFAAPGMTRSINLMTNRSNQLIKSTFNTWQLLDPYNRLRREVKNYLADHQEYLIEAGFALNIEENLVNGFLVFTDYIHLSDFPAKFKVQYDISGYAGNITWQVFEKEAMRAEGRQPILKQTTKSHQHQSFTLAFQPKADRVYALSAQLVANPKNAQININNLLVWLKAKVE
ncbi:class I SAM-dependent methyltransferase [Marinicella meishanensis]|uniref:class I SAM-dependent methyltransferase n=1 Tax=Marinicella meishanensis TaxID=2873263 RepID=UPI001CC13A0D|nr:class I SAM-dependent methyltransferase [Marinicella sp. NBU2979]